MSENANGQKVAFFQVDQNVALIKNSQYFVFSK
jgi:hypothetical protein